jgi:hypothetical protein
VCSTRLPTERDWFAITVTLLEIAIILTAAVVVYAAIHDN